MGHGLKLFLCICASVILVSAFFLDFTCLAQHEVPGAPAGEASNLISASGHAEIEEIEAPIMTTLSFDLSKFDLKQAANGIRASDWCRQSCRARFPCTSRQVKQCFWHRKNATCTCRDEMFLPTEWFRDERQNEGNGNASATNASIALLMAGQVRSFTSNLMQEYWRHFLAKLEREAFAPVTLFGVFSIKSTNKKGGNTRPHGEATFFQTKELQRLLDGLSVVWRAVFPEESNWTSTAALVKDPALAFLLSPPAHLLRVAAQGHTNVYRSRVVAFDMMLQFEQEFHKRFTYVLFVRPDIIYDFSFQSISSCPDAVMCFNDMFAAMWRNLAPWYATHVATIRALEGRGWRPTSIPKYTEKIQQLLGWHVNGGWIAQPALHLARHGIPYFGERLDVAEKDAIPCNSHTRFDHWMIRDVASNLSLSKDVCSVRPNIAVLKKCLLDMGVSGNLSSKIGVCHDY